MEVWIMICPVGAMGGIVGGVCSPPSRAERVRHLALTLTLSQRERGLSAEVHSWAYPCEPSKGKGVLRVGALEVIDMAGDNVIIFTTALRPERN